MAAKFFRLPLLTFIAVSFLSALAAAEVCDKVEEGGVVPVAVLVMGAILGAIGFVLGRRPQGRAIIVMPVSAVLLAGATLDIDILELAWVEGCGWRLLVSPLLVLSLALVGTGGGLLVFKCTRSA